MPAAISTECLPDLLYTVRLYAARTAREVKNAEPNYSTLFPVCMNGTIREVVCNILLTPKCDVCKLDYSVHGPNVSHGRRLPSLRAINTDFDK